MDSRSICSRLPREPQARNGCLFRSDYSKPPGLPGFRLWTAKLLPVGLDGQDGWKVSLSRSGVQRGCSVCQAKELACVFRGLLRSAWAREDG